MLGIVDCLGFVFMKNCLSNFRFIILVKDVIRLINGLIYIKFFK